jgi:hypothetical protein
MSRSVDVLAVDWERIRRTLPDWEEERLAAGILERGRRVVRATRDPARHGSESRHADFANELALLAVLRYDFVVGRRRFSRAREAEERTYERHLVLNRDVVPPLKLRAKALIAELRGLEEEAAALGIDLEAVKPRIPWDRTVLVDSYSPPAYESNEERRKRTVEFFRRIRPT